MLGIADVLPSALSSTFMICLTRKMSMIILPIIITILVPLYYFLDMYEFVALAILLSIRFSMTLQYTFINYAIYEYFPATFTTMVFGIANITSGLFTIFAPMAVELLDEPFYLVMVIAFFGAGFSLMLTSINKK